MKILSSLFLALALVGSAFAQQTQSITNKVVVLIPSNAIATSGSPADLQSVILPSSINRYTVTNVYAYTTAASGTLALATVDVRTAAAGGGTSLLTAPVALVGLTAVNLVQNMTPLTLGTTFANGSIFVRQTVNSANAGTLTIAVEILVLN